MLVNTGLIRTLGTYGVSPPIPSFYSPLTSSIVPSTALGSSTPTYSRATSATFTDWEGVVRLVLSGEARFQGARRVRNLVATKSEDATADITSQANNTQTTTTVSLNSANASYWYKANSPTLPIGAFVTARIQLSAGTKTNIAIRVAGDLNGAGSVLTNVVLTGTPTWYSVTTSTGSTVAQKFSIGLENRSSVGASDTGTGSVNVFACQIEDTTGQSNTNPSEYVSVGVLSAPYHGANVDGVKYFTTQNGNTVASNVVTEATGAAISSTTLLGYLAEGARTNEVLWNRDLTNAAWVKTTATAAKDQTGIDGSANSASSLTATAANATCLQVITEAAATREFSAFVKRITGTGEIDMTEDGGLTWTNITASINSSTYMRVTIPAQSFLNPNVGFRIVTSGDKIAVDMCQNEAGSFASSPIPTTTVAVTRNADVLSYDANGNTVATQGTMYAEMLHVAAGTSAVADAFCLSPSGLEWYLDQTNNSFFVKNRIDNNAISSGNLSSSVISKLAANWLTGGTYRACVNGNPVVSFAQVGTGTLTTIEIGHNTGSGQLFGTLRNVRIWTTQLSDTILQSITT